MSWKDNLYRAAKELIGESGDQAPEETPQRMRDLIGELSDVVRQDGDGEAPFDGREDAREDGGPEASSEPEAGEAIPMMASLAPPRRKTVIAEDAVVRGDIETAGGVELYGDMQGELKSEEDILISGKLIGDSTSRSMSMAGGRMRGDVVAVDTARIDEDSILLGAIKATELILGGKVRGNLDIRESVVLAEHAVVLGNITARGLSVAPGAAIQGELRIAAQDINAAFQDESI